ncbi:MAG: YhjD/YihY/BrkB family envelope integrity protein [Prevotella sp.]|nr:YhjD/YihY/BrkB family envelope integrity protein [Prevotella sp.]
MTWKTFIDTLKLTVRLFTTKRVMNEAAALTYSSLLALVPILAVVFAISRGFGYNRYIEQWFLEAFKSQPQAAETIVGFVNSYLVHTKSGVFLGIGLIFMLYTVLMLVSNIERTFNSIWQVKKSRSFFRTCTDYMAMLLLMPFIIVVTSGISIFMATEAHSFMQQTILAPAMKMIIDLLPYFVMGLLFVALYVFMPNTHVRVKCCIVPGFLSGVAMQLLQLFYIHSQIWVSSYNAIYGSFAALPLLMLWVQLSWTICLFGAELCYINQNLDDFDFDANAGDLSHRSRMMMFTVIMSTICKRFDKGLKPLTALGISKETGVPSRIVNELLYQLIDAGLVVELSSDDKGDVSHFMPAESVERLSVGKMIDHLEALGKLKLSFPSEMTLRGELWKKVIEIRRDYLRQMKDILLKDL